jgi:hypothetical protein
MLMDIPAPGLNVGLQIGDAVDDGHGSLSFGCFVLCSMPAAIRPSLLPGCTAAAGGAMALKNDAGREA